MTLSGTALVLAFGIGRKDASLLPPVYRLGLGLGLILAFALSTSSGLLMGSGTGHSVGIVPFERQIFAVCWLVNGGRRRSAGPLFWDACAPGRSGRRGGRVADLKSFAYNQRAGDRVAFSPLRPTCNERP